MSGDDVPRGTITALAKLKAADRKEAVYLVMNDPEMKRLILAWTVVPVFVMPNPVEATQVSGFNEIVAAAWGYYRPGEYETIAAMAELPIGTTKIKLEVLRRQGLIYPDGTANENALLVIRAEVSAGLRKISPTRRKQGDAQ